MNKQIEQVELKLIEVIQRLEEVDGVVLKVNNKEDQIFLEYDYEELLDKYLNDYNFVSAYIEPKENVFEINKILLVLKNVGQAVLEVL